MGNKYLIDTNILIYYLNDSIPKGEIAKLEQIFINSFNISTISKIEVLGWHKITEKERNKIELFINNSKIFYINRTIEEKSIKIKQKYKIATPDTIIAATALEYNFIIVTRNKSDFSKIERLNIYNPFDSK